MKLKDDIIIFSLIVLMYLVFYLSLCLQSANDRIIDLEFIVNSIAEHTTEFDKKQEEQSARIDILEHDVMILDLRLDAHRQELTDNAELFSDLLASVEHLEEYCRSLPDNVLGVEVSDEDIRDIAALVYLESGSQSYKCQKAIASVIFNRMIRYDMSAQSVIHEPGVFSPAARVDRTRPSASCLMAVREVLEQGCTLPPRVTAFRNGHYHNFGSHYCCIDGVYFSLV